MPARGISTLEGILLLSWARQPAKPQISRSEGMTAQARSCSVRTRRRWCCHAGANWADPVACCHGKGEILLPPSQAQSRNLFPPSCQLCCSSDPPTTYPREPRRKLPSFPCPFLSCWAWSHRDSMLKTLMKPSNKLQSPCQLRSRTMPPSVGPPPFTICFINLSATDFIPGELICF